MTPPMSISLAVLLVCAAVLGTIWGLRAISPDETRIISSVAADYVAETGGALTDCFARPSALPDVRMVVICDAGSGPAWARAVDRYGATVQIDPDRLTEELQT